jgi:plastocyanin domain-containing protein
MTLMKTVLSTLAIAALSVACSKSETKSAGDKPATTDKAPAPAADRVAISVTEKGFEPENVSVPSGKPVTLVFTRKTDSTCAKEVVIPLDGQKIEKKLPLDEAVAVEVTFPKAGQITYACGMDMVKGIVTVQ